MRVDSFGVVIRSARDKLLSAVALEPWQILEQFSQSKEGSGADIWSFEPDIYWIALGRTLIRACRIRAIAEHQATIHCHLSKQIAILPVEE